MDFLAFDKLGFTAHRLCIALTVAITLSMAGHPTAADEPPDDELTLADEMISQGDRRAAQGLSCEAAEYYRAVVGERPEIFRSYAEARADCLRADAR